MSRDKIEVNATGDDCKVRVNGVDWKPEYSPKKQYKGSSGIGDVFKILLMLFVIFTVGSVVGSGITYATLSDKLCVVTK